MLRLGWLKASVAALLVAGPCVTASPALAQSAAETPADALSRNIRVLASSPRDFNALIGAGRAALELGDVQAAAGFFGRAEEANPNAPAAKVGLGAAMAHMGDADGAIFYFEQAAKLGAQPMVMATDRGMAKDLQGDLKGAQADYRLAIASLGSDEARRRLALSLAIGRDRKAAMEAIQPLLNRHDAAAQRTRAFVLALVGDQIAAAQAIDAVMPGAGARFAPFFRYLPNLSTAEKAAAVHLGIFPEDASTRVAAAEITPPEPDTAAPAKVAMNVTPPVKQSVRRPEPRKPTSMEIAGRVPPRKPQPVAAPVKTAQNPPAPSFSLPSDKASSASPSFSMPPASGAAPTESELVPVETTTAPASTEETAAEGNLNGIDKLLATMAEAPPPPEPKLDPKKPAAQDKAAKAAAAKKAAEKKAREEEAKLGVKGTYWVQLAGGSNQKRMATEYKKLSAKAGKLLKSRSGYVTGGKDYFRLLVGPFGSKSEAQAFVNKLEKEGVDGFSWTRTPPKIKIEKLSKP
ncbi:SPOR domain-containing protein [Sphingomonas sp.]|uniref:SPOR domain-containing protein n=1 Tax=Sphingomonas sp. TaxID=28214 RepID=UPI0025F83EF9|nr:SPOR domain-containing protein [Sphingomonas sp.]